MTIDYQFKQDNLSQGETSMREEADLDLLLRLSGEWGSPPYTGTQSEEEERKDVKRVPSTQRPGTESVPMGKDGCSHTWFLKCACLLPCDNTLVSHLVILQWSTLVLKKI